MAGRMRQQARMSTGGKAPARVKPNARMSISVNGKPKRLSWKNKNPHRFQELCHRFQIVEEGRQEEALQIPKEESHGSEESVSNRRLDESVKTDLDSVDDAAAAVDQNVEDKCVPDPE